MTRAILATCLLLPTLAAAQSVPVAQSWGLEFGQPEFVADYAHTVSLDGGAATPLAATCDPTGACVAPLPALTPGSHTVTIRSTRTVDGVAFAAPEAEAATIAVNLIVVQGPVNLRVTVQQP